MPRGQIEARIAAEDSYSSAIAVHGDFNLSLSGTWTATVWVQRSFDGGVTWLDVKSYTDNVEEIGEEVERGVLYRFGVKTGGFTLGPVVGRISQ